MLEYVDSSKRTLVGNLGLALFLTLSGVYQPWAIKYAYFKFLQKLYFTFLRYFGDWKVFNWVMFSQMGIIVFVPFILPESCRWLMAKGKGEKLLKILKRIAKINKKEVKQKFVMYCFSLSV